MTYINNWWLMLQTMKAIERDNNQVDSSSEPEETLADLFDENPILTLIVLPTLFILGFIFFCLIVIFILYTAVNLFDLADYLIDNYRLKDLIRNYNE